MGEKEKVLHCSFCGKSDDEGVKLVAGPSVFICNECVELCNAILGQPEKPDGHARTICKFCGSFEDLDQMLRILDKNFICKECMPIAYEEIRKWHLKNDIHNAF